ncbi:MAG: NAD(P)/FAD-dependent oxidoreductase [Polyangiaceae bacterium]
MEFDVVIAGGGPGGSICAAQLAKRGLTALVLEKAHHPRFHLGESLLPQSMPVLKEIGIFDDIHDRFIVKRGANFHESGTLKQARYDFAEAFDRSTTFAFEVPRDEFDDMLFRHAQKCGADVREGFKVDKIDCKGAENGGPVQVATTDESGATHTFECKLAIDATGRDAITAHEKRATEKVPELDKTAVFSMWQNAWRDAGDREGDIQIVVFGTGDETGWFWSIPFKDGRTSIGAVLASTWIKRRKSTATSIPDLYSLAISESPAMQRIVGGATQMMPARAMADFSYRVRDLAGPGWIAVGDAGGFIDPLFSTGAHLAMYGGFHAANKIADVHATGRNIRPEDFSEWSALMRKGAELFLGSVQAFYRGSLTPYLFADDQHPFLRRAITSMLAGDVFTGHDRWVREMQTRFPAILS